MNSPVQFFDINAFCAELCAELVSAGLSEPAAKTLISRALRATVAAEEVEA